MRACSEVKKQCALDEFVDAHGAIVAYTLQLLHKNGGFSMYEQVQMSKLGGSFRKAPRQFTASHGPCARQPSGARAHMPGAGQSEKV